MQASPSIVFTPSSSANRFVGPSECDCSPPSASKSVHSLPPEILASIFLHCVPFILKDQQRQGPTDNWTYLQNLRFVCHSWNDIIVAYPRLWTFVRPVEIRGETLARNLRMSGDLALDVYINMQVLNSELLEILVQELGRVRNLVIVAVTDCAVLEKVFSDSFTPLLESLVVVRDCRLFSRSPVPWEFRGDLRNVKTFMASNVLCFPKSVPGRMFGSLVEFNLAFMKFTCVIPTLTGVLEVLSGNRATLRKISILYAFRAGLRSEASVTPASTLARTYRIGLSTLQNLTIVDYPAAVKRLISCLILPDSATVRIQSRFPVELLASDDWEPLVSLLPDDAWSCFRGLLRHATKLFLMRRQDSDDSSFVVLDDRGKPILYIGLGVENTQGAAVWAESYRNAAVADLLSYLNTPSSSPVRALLPVQQIQEIGFDLDGIAMTFSLNIWCTVFSSLQNLGTLRLTVLPCSEDTAENLLSELIWLDDVALFRRNLCPHLQVLTVECNLRALMHAGGQPPRGWMGALHAVVSSRSAKGQPLHKLAFGLTGPINMYVFRATCAATIRTFSPWVRYVKCGVSQRKTQARTNTSRSANISGDGDEGESDRLLFWWLTGKNLA